MKALFEKALDNAVFKRMEADDGQSTGRRQKSPSTFQSGLEFIELVVDLNTPGTYASPDAEQHRGDSSALPLLRALQALRL